MAFDPEGAWLCFGFSGVVFRSLCGLRDPTSLSGGDVFPQELLVFLCMSSSSVLPPRPSLHPLPPRLKDRAAFARRSSEAIPAGQFGENIRHGVSRISTKYAFERVLGVFSFRAKRGPPGAPQRALQYTLHT